uniref:Uncharacterized protein n=1 Tax=Fagus sylvatica TaxID=28930 RepID=A0A2N9GEM8_FAGSY
MGHAAYRRKALDVLLSNGINFTKIGVRTRELWTPGSRGTGAVFVCFSGEDSGQTGEAAGEPRVARRSRSRYLSNAPGPERQLAASRKDSVREGGYFDVLGTVGKLALPIFLQGSWIRGKSELRTERYGPANRGRRSVFGPFEGSFPMKIPARPGKVLDDPRVPHVHECVFFPMCPGLWINLLYRPCTEANLGSARYDPANGGRWNVPCTTGSFSDRDSGLTGGALDDPEVACCS